MRKTLSIALASVLLFSCESLVKDFEIKKPGDKITMVGYALADSLPSFYLTPNLGIDDSIYFPPIADANVELYMNGALVDALELNDSGWFSHASYTFIAGNDYSLRASASGYPTVMADFSVPAVPVMTVIDTNLIVEEYPDCPDCGKIYALEFQLEFLNQPASVEYYSVEVEQATSCVESEYNHCEGITTYSNELNLTSNVPYIETARMYDDAYYNRNAGEESSGFEFYFSDRSLDDGQNRLIFRADLNAYEFSSTSNFWLILIFKKIDKPMFEYVQSKGRNANAGSNPFVQPVSIYSNVENGLGLVSGSSQVEYLVDLTEIISNLDMGGYYQY
jgi:hypothetical protein